MSRFSTPETNQCDNITFGAADVEDAINLVKKSTALFNKVSTEEDTGINMTSDDVNKTIDTLNVIEYCLLKEIPANPVEKEQKKVSAIGCVASEIVDKYYYCPLCKAQLTEYNSNHINFVKVNRCSCCGKKIKWKPELNIQK